MSEHVLREWLAAIRLEVEARGSAADLATIKGYAEAALAGEVPHWYTDEYRTKVGHTAAEWESLVAEANSLGYIVQVVEYCEGPDSPGLLGAGLGVCVYPKRIIRIREALRPEDRVWVLEHELGHARISAAGGDKAAQDAYDHEHYNDPQIIERKHRINDYLYPPEPS